MLKLLIVADDFTGALDSGVQFASGGAKVKVITDSNYDLTKASELDVLIFDSETRHEKPDTAYKIVYEFKESGINQDIDKNKTFKTNIKVINIEVSK